jgi:hypothetical protein
LLLSFGYQIWQFNTVTRKLSVVLLCVFRAPLHRTGGSKALTELLSSHASQCDSLASQYNFPTQTDAGIVLSDGHSNGQTGAVSS